MKNKNVSLIAKWWLKDSKSNDFDSVLRELAEASRKEEGVLLYHIHRPIPINELSCDNCKVAVRNIPGTIVFYEKYIDMDAFNRHTQGKNLNKFIESHKNKFVLGKDGGPYVEVEFLEDII